MSEHPHILAVIPCLNEEAYLENLVENLLASTQDLSILFVIADGGSADRSPEIAHALAAHHRNVVFLYNPKRYQSAAVNLAVVTHGEGAEFLIRIDAHAGYPENYCRTLVEEAESTKAASVVTAMKTEGKSFFQRVAAAVQNSKLGHGGAAHRTLSAGKWVDHGHHALIRIDAFRKMGGYDEDFSHNEDAEFDTRLQKAGLKIWLTGKTFLTYYPRSGPLALFAQYIRHGQGRALTILKHRALPRLRQLAPAAVLPAVLLALLTPWFCLALAPLAVWAGFCLIYGLFLTLRTGNPETLAAGPVAMIMHAGWSLGFWQTMIGKMGSRN